MGARGLLRRRGLVCRQDAEGAAVIDFLADGCAGCPCVGRARATPPLPVATSLPDGAEVDVCVDAGRLGRLAFLVFAPPLAALAVVAAVLGEQSSPWRVIVGLGLGACVAAVACRTLVNANAAVELRPTAGVRALAAKLR